MASKITKPTTATATKPAMTKRQLERFDAIAMATGHTRERVIEEWSDRAAIREHLGNMTRVEAEFHAFIDAENVLKVTAKPPR